jgi:hypothetical protein
MSIKSLFGCFRIVSSAKARGTLAAIAVMTGSYYGLRSTIGIEVREFVIGVSFVALHIAIDKLIAWLFETPNSQKSRLDDWPEKESNHPAS